MKVPTRERFLEDVASHKMTIHKDDGVFRHVQFSDPKSGNMAFSLTTWPDYLAISGDAGTYAFTRTRDMFQFFRQPFDHFPDHEIDFDYWAQKCEAYDRSGGLRKYSPRDFKESILKDLDEMDAGEELREAVDRDVLWYADDGYEEAVRAAIEFEFEDDKPFENYYHDSFETLTGRFVWCCMAIAWGVSKYDNFMAGVENL